MLGIEIEKKRIYGIDLLRVIAILCVIHAHGRHLLGGSSFEFLANIPLPHGVDIFFVISGFLIGTSFISYYEKSSKVNSSKVLHFYGRTMLRILPNYYVVLLIYCLLVNRGIVNGSVNEFPIWRFFTFTQNIFTPFYNFYWESWSLSVQFWFYIIFPFILFALPKGINVKKVIPFVCIFFIMMSLIFRYIVSKHVTDSFWWDVWIRKTVASRFDNIYIGVLAAWVKFYHTEFWKNNSIKSLALGIVLMIATFVVPRHIGSLYANVFYLTVSPIAIVLWFPYVTNLQTYKTIIGNIISHFSILSYAMFLVNLMIIQIIDCNFADIFKPIGGYSYLIYWLVVMIASYILYIIVEKRFIKIRSKIM